MSPINKDQPNPQPLALGRRFAGYGIGVAAVAAGVILPQKAGADIISQVFNGITQNDDFGIINLRFNGQTELQAATALPFSYSVGFNFYLLSAYTGVSYGGVYVYGDNITEYSMLVYQGISYYYPNDVLAIFYGTYPINLASPGTEYDWSPTVGFAFGLPQGIPFRIGLRKTTATEAFYGWAELQLGSMTINQAAFNDTDGGSITIGQVPEPHSLTLLLGGAAGLHALRRRRKKAESTADA